ncbi:hypothetical protein KDI_06970 [Dictyobacter arantiisoli]|uniref:Uncharacterized protein n=1 Tax=Dictyobacter arantiisoli TaxID=2014874 RepID=A0A5A5T7Y5_9CHLR|nr:hypothetical protein KDI_06970 [Dictyobacter arantiisoli]
MTTLEVQPNVGFIPDNPGIVPWWEQLDVAWTYFTLRAIIHAHV